MLKSRCFWAVLLAGALIGGAALAQDPSGVQDTVALEIVQAPDFSTGEDQLVLELWVYSDELISAATVGFSWDNAKLQADSAVGATLATDNFEIGPFFYQDNNIAITNANQNFLFGGSVLFGNGVPGDAAGRRLWATYYFTATGWGECDEFTIDSLQFNSGSEWLFVGEGNVNFRPEWTGPVTYADTACAPPANLVVSPSALTFEGVEGEGNPASQSFNVSSDGDPVDYAVSTSAGWITPAPASGTTPEDVQVAVDISTLTAGTYNETLTVTSSTAANSPQTVAITVNIAPPPNEPPVLAAIPGQETTEQVLLSFGVSATDPNGTTPALAAAPLPVGATFLDNGDGTGDFNWTPTFDDAGTYPIMFYAIDSEDPELVDSQEVLITVLDSNRVPVVSVEEITVEGFEGDELTMRVTATDPDGTTPGLAANIVGETGLAPNMTFVDSGNGVGVLTFLPDFNQGDDDPTVYTVEFLATDEVYPGDIVVSAPHDFRVFNTNQPPAVAAINDATICGGQTLTIPVAAEDPDEDPLDMWVEPVYPMLTFDYVGGGIGTIIFAPADTDIGDYPVTVYASDGSDTAIEAFTISVVDCAAQDTGSVVVMPNEVGYYMQFAYEPIMVTAYVGDFVGGHTASQVDPATVTVEGGIAPAEVNVLPGYGSFTGEVLEVKFAVADYLAQFGAFFDTQIDVVTVEGGFIDEDIFTVGADMTLIGHTSGDLNGDKKVNLADVTDLIAYFYQGGPEPRVLAAADVDGRCNINVSDVTYLIRFLFKGGAAPMSTCQ